MTSQYSSPRVRLPRSVVRQRYRSSERCEVAIEYLCATLTPRSARKIVEACCVSSLVM